MIMVTKSIIMIHVLAIDLLYLLLTHVFSVYRAIYIQQVAAQYSGHDSNLENKGYDSNLSHT